MPATSGYLRGERGAKAKANQGNRLGFADILEFLNCCDDVLPPAGKPNFRIVARRITGTIVIEPQNIEAPGSQLTTQIAKGAMRKYILRTPRVTNHRGLGLARPNLRRIKHTE